MIKGAAILAAFLGFCVSVWFFYPGCMSGDSLFSYGEGVWKSAPKFHDVHPPFIAFFWYVISSVIKSKVHQYGAMFLFTNGLFWAGLGLLGARQASPWRAALLVIAVGFFPPIFAMTSQNIKDIMMIAPLVMALGLLVTTTHNPRWERTRHLAIAAMLLLCVLFRHNGIVAALPILVMWAYQLKSHMVSGGKELRALAKTPAMTAALFVALYFTSGLINKALTLQTSYPLHLVQVFDLVGMSVKDNTVYVPEVFADYKKPPTLENFWAVKGYDLDENPRTLENLKQLYEASHGLNIYFYGPGKGLRFLDDPDDINEVRKAWLNALITSPMTYVSVRYDLFMHLLKIRPHGMANYFCNGRGASNYVSPLLTENRLNTPWPYFIINTGLVLLALFMPSGRKHLPLLLSGWLFTMSFTVFNVTAEFRYTWWLITSTVLTLMLWGLDTQRHSPKPASLQDD